MHRFYIFNSRIKFEIYRLKQAIVFVSYCFLLLNILCSMTSQHRRVQMNPKSSSYKFTPKEDAVSGFPIDPPARAAADNGYPQRVPLMQAGRSSSTLGRSSGMDPKAQRFHTSQIVTTEMSGQSTASGQRGNAPKMSNLGESARRQYLREHRSSSRYSQLTAADPSDRPEWNHQFQERPSSSHRKDDAVANKEHTVVSFKHLRFV
jgi:hypothetical protein